MLEETKSLKYFGLGPYFYVEFMRRICWIFFIFAIMEGVRTYINFRSSGLANYSISFSSYLITSTLGKDLPTQATSTVTLSVVLTPTSLLLSQPLFSSSFSSSISAGSATSTQRSRIKRPIISISSLRSFVLRLVASMTREKLQSLA